MPALMDPDGAFACAEAEADDNRCRNGEPLPYEAPTVGTVPRRQKRMVVTANPCY